MKMNTKSYVEIKVPITYDKPWFQELRSVLKDIPVLWQKAYYHITIAFIDYTHNISIIKNIIESNFRYAPAINVTFDKLDIFTTNSGLQIVHLTAENVPTELQNIIDNIRRDIFATESQIQSNFRLHVTLGRISEPEIDIDDIGFLIDDIDFQPFSLILNEIEYRLYKGRSLYRKTLGSN